MTNSPPRPATTMLERIEQLELCIFGDLKGTAGEPRLITLIRNIAHEHMRAEKCLRDRGAWSADTAYGAGAAVTHDGVLWIAQVESKGQRPGTSAAWRLSSKSIDVQLRREIRSLIRDELRKARADER